MMARKKGETPEPVKSPKPDLSDEDRLNLLMQHKAAYEHRLAGKKKADADFKNACKLAKSELGEHAVEEIKLAISLETDEGEAELRARMERQVRVARWMGASVGTQFDLGLGAAGEMSSTDRAFAEGKRAAAAGEKCTPPAHYAPGSPDYEFWINGHHEQGGIATIGRGRIGSETPSHQVQQ
jgi:hypothetical protein